MNRDMAPLVIAGLRSDLDAVLSALHKVGCLHIDPIEDMLDRPPAPWQHSAEATRQHHQADILLAQIEGVIQQVGGCSEPAATPPYDFHAIESAFSPIRQQVTAIQNKCDRLAEELETLPRYRATLRNLLPLITDDLLSAADLKETNWRLIGALVSREHQQVIGLLRRQVNEASGGRVKFIEGVIDAQTHGIILVVPHDDVETVEAILGSQNVPRLRLPEGYEAESPDAAIARLEQRLTQIPKLLEEQERRLQHIGEEWCRQLVAWRQQLISEQACYAIRHQLGETVYTFVISGWAPRSKVPQIHEALATWMVHIEELPLTPHLRAKTPVAQRNIPMARPFEGLVKVIAIPHYDGIDPSLLMAIFLPLFFGMMLGDIGYGVVILLGATLALTRVKKGMLRDLVWVLIMGAFWAIAFGFAYGELFGTLGEHIGLHPLLFDRAHAEYAPALLLMTIGVGAAHTALGLGLGMWQAIKHRHRSHLLERGGMLLGLIGLFALVGTLTDLLPAELRTLSTALLIIGLVLLMVSLGPMGIFLGPLEFIGMIGNVLSYLRIAAIGLASVYLALVANELAGSLGSLVVGLIVAVLIHALNIVLGAFSPTIHSLRLHYVEFFRKFYEGGGRLFTPFAEN